ncbi:hypothetical protein GCM10022265_30610 [Marinobacter xestospongiae]
MDGMDVNAAIHTPTLSGEHHAGEPGALRFNDINALIDHTLGSVLGGKAVAFTLDGTIINVDKLITISVNEFIVVLGITAPTTTGKNHEEQTHT